MQISAEITTFNWLKALFSAEVGTKKHKKNSNFETCKPVTRIVKQALVAAIQRETFENVCLLWRDIVDQTSCDLALSKLLHAVEFDFHCDVSNSHLKQPCLPFHEGYYVFVGVITYRDRFVVPVSLRDAFFKALHAAHQDVSP